MFNSSFCLRAVTSYDDLKTENKSHFTSSFSLRDHDFGHHEELVEYPILRDHDEQLAECPLLQDHVNVDDEQLLEPPNHLLDRDDHLDEYSRESLIQHVHDEPLKPPILRDRDLGHHEELVEYPNLRDHVFGHHEKLVEYPNLRDRFFLFRFAQ
ncbi:unnamed protein product [Caenorhabditis brenneri]